MSYSEARYERVPVPEEPPERRVRSFDEVLHSYTKDEAIMEASRCLQCALPFCVEACPITQDARGYIGLIAGGEFDSAADVILRENPLATTLCKVCYHYCEDACIMGHRGIPIAIRHLKRAALELGDSQRTYVPSAPRHQRIAVVGAGPAGLMAAWELGLKGYGVTVFEKAAVVGGQAEAIPHYRMPGSELLTDLDRFKDLDVTFVASQKAGVDFDPEALLTQGYKAVYLAVGASKPGSPGIPGENLSGVIYALDFLLEANEGIFPVLGKQIVVVGGGDVAIDSVRSAVRLSPGAHVTMAYRRTKDEAPCGPEEIHEAEPEGIEFRWLLSPVQILGTDRVTGMVFQRMQLAPPDASGRRAVVAVPGALETIACDTVIMAIGQVADLTGFPSDLQLKIGTKGWPEGVQSDTMTAVPGVFASGGRSVVHAMAAGTRAAEAIDAFLSKKDGRTPAPRPDPFGGTHPPARTPPGYSEPVWRA
ncbi:MAG: FAD-dependent oxidoreductase [Thermoplasmata archaeon]|nr:FAD-dependent oxidoreductase [Thermoplasmata archaeon]MCI4353868.1 FAD-dependent oxidoreductase [Thermoplasmata archaeon]